MARKRLPELPQNFDDVAVLLWDTRYANYDFVNQLNLVYELQLSCEDDLIFYSADQEELSCPLYTFYQEETKLIYVLVENPIPDSTIDPSLEYYDKILFVCGRDCREVCETMRREANYGVSVEDPYDLRMSEHSARLALFRNGGVVQVESMVIDKDGMVMESSQLADLNPNLRNKMVKRLAPQGRCLSEMFAVVNDVLDPADDDMSFF